MARIWQPDVTPDLFGDITRGVSHPGITWETYHRITKAAAKKFNPILKDITASLFNDVARRFNARSNIKVSLVKKRSLLVTVFVTSINDTDAFLFLSFDDLMALPEVRHELLSDLAVRACFGAAIEVRGENLVGHVSLPIPENMSPFVLPQRISEPWSLPTADVGPEVEALEKLARARKSA